MTTKELMLGNYVEMFIKDFGFHDEIVDLNLLSQIDFHNDQEFDNDDIYFVPIELTEKWLLDFGFNKDYKIGYVGKDFGNTDFVLTVPLTLGEWQKGYVFEFLSGGWSKFVEFNHVHELQNFYFTITKSVLQLGGFKYLTQHR